MNLLQRRTVVPIIGLTLALVSPASARDNSALKESLAYLRGIEEVAWVEFEDNNVYIGFTRRPPDLAAIVNAASVIGNRAHDFGVHVWAVSGQRRGWRPGAGPYFCEATARYGELKDPCK